MLRFFRRPEFVLKIKQDRYQNYILESLRIPASSESELIASSRRITEVVAKRLKELNE
jgi:hypothetical protein